ncbi:sodium-coupled monocarboxylate transporter 2-like isoform X2 [Frieseomelitta varia]|uniref:sodium-coupled monocarboxylate transporter 2-like isoform X2 n=1 Tax=Frieseomelitta varia TaxID=561572 RepID=UPI001CB67F94|nr:sodium-coupled monocarboxylate transporter 2-like isoform X2 [Frieseomelitta varia]
MDESGDGTTRRSFDAIDCAVFAGMLAVSAIIGVYQAYKSRKNEDAVREYLVGGQAMSIFPITMSLIASYISGITILGLPAEMYVYGTQFWSVVIADSFVSLTMIVVYLPVFYGLGITSSYELLYIPLVIYVPALAFNQVTGINLHAIAVLVCVVCIFYTTLGGLKAVVWTDAVQTIVMFGGVIAIAAIGTNQVGGFQEVWKRNRDTDRIEFFDMDLDPTARHTFWTVVVGNYFSWLASCSVNQAMVQRCLAMPNLNKANITIAIMAVGIITIVSLSCYTGIVIFAAFYDCDPITTKQIKKPDQLLPFFVMEMTESIPGLPGLFVAGVFSAALSTMSTGLNSMSGVIYEDMVKPWLRVSLSEVAASRVMKLTVVLTGTLCVTLVFLVEKLTGLIQAAKSLSGITAGPLLGIFTLGMFFPFANSAGALVGGLVSLNLVAWISFGTQAAISSGKIHFPVKPVSIDGCPQSLKNHATNFTLVVETAIKEQPFFLYRMSYLWYTWVGCLTAIVVGLLVSWITGPNKRKPGDEKLYTPVIRSLLRKTATIVGGKRQQETVAELEKMDDKSVTRT